MTVRHSRPSDVAVDDTFVPSSMRSRVPRTRRSDRGPSPVVRTDAGSRRNGPPDRPKRRVSAVVVSIGPRFGHVHECRHERGMVRSVRRHPSGFRPQPLTADFAVPQSSSVTACSAGRSRRILPGQPRCWTGVRPFRPSLYSPWYCWVCVDGCMLTSLTSPRHGSLPERLPG